MKPVARPWYAINARNLLERRKRGEKCGIVAVCLIDGTDNSDASVALIVKPDMPAERLDWRMLVDLEVWLWADSTVPLDRVLFHVERIAQMRPARLVLRFKRGDSTHDVEVGAGFHNPAVLDIPAQHEFKWCPINLTGSKAGAQFRKALIQQNGQYATL